MSEFCLDCFNELYNANYKKRHVVLDYDYCEGCGEWKKCVVDIRRITKGGTTGCLIVIIIFAAISLIPYLISLYDKEYTEPYYGAAICQTPRQTLIMNDELLSDL